MTQAQAQMPAQAQAHAPQIPHSTPPNPTCQGARRAVHGHSSDEPQAALAADEQLLQIIPAQAPGEEEEWVAAGWAVR